MRLDHVLADFGGVAAEKLADTSLLSAVLLAAANAAGLSPTGKPIVTTSTDGVAALLACRGGHVAILAAPHAGLGFFDLAAAGAARGAVQRAADIVARRLGAKEVRTDVKQRGPVIRGGPVSAR